MGIEFTNSVDEGINFGNMPAVLGNIAKSWEFWFVINSQTNNTFDFLFHQEYVVLATGEGADIYFNGNDIVGTSSAIGLNVRFHNGAVPTSGIWEIPRASFGTGVLVHLVITYDGSDVGNNPVFYVDGSPVAETEISAPVGVWNSGSTGDMSLGDNTSTPATFKSMDGNLYMANIYNRILSADEVTSLFDSRGASLLDGRIFHTRPIGFAGGVIDGDALGATDYAIDYMNGYIGTPHGSPVAESDPYLLME